MFVNEFRQNKLTGDTNIISLHRVCQSDLVEIVHGFRPVSIGARNNGNEAIDIGGDFARGEGILGPLVSSGGVWIEVIHEANEVVAHLSSAVYIQNVREMHRAKSWQEL